MFFEIIIFVIKKLDIRMAQDINILIKKTKLSLKN